MTEKPDFKNGNPTDPTLEAGLHEQIEKRAYHLWLKGGSHHGDDLRHWLQAEAEILKELSRNQVERNPTRKNSPKAKTRSLPLPDETYFKD
jgi:hypothetical protein